MQYFSIIARKADDPARTCAMLQDSTLQGAAEKARHLVLSEALPHVEKNSRFSVRRSSRRETSLLQAFLASGTGDRMSTYLQEDLDSLMSRRNSMLLSFFMALYLDPTGLKRRFDASPSGRRGTIGTGSSGSGGVALDPELQEAPTEEAALQDGTQTPASIQEAPLDSAMGDDESVSAEDVVSDDNQISALEDIVNGASDRGDDDEIDIF